MTDDAKQKQREAGQLKRSNAEADAAQRARSIAAAIAYEQKKPHVERLRRSQAIANTPEAWAARNDFDPFTGK